MAEWRPAPGATLIVRYRQVDTLYERLNRYWNQAGNWLEHRIPTQFP
jgi:hypothetical protein